MPADLVIPSCALTQGSSIFATAQALLLERDVGRALAAFDKAQHCGYPAHECASGRWQCWMLLGDFEQAWLESDEISNSGIPDPHRFWDGSPWAHRRVILRCLHGLGDTIQFIRYAPLLRQTCSKLIVQTHPQLVSLLATVSGVDESLTWQPPYREDLSTWDLQMEINELPRIFRTSLDTIPAICPYISIPQDRLLWASQWIPPSRRPRVGLVWQAGPWNESRSMQLSDLLPLLNLSEMEFYCLQKEADPQLLVNFPTLRNVEAHSRDVLDTAALIAHLDLVITVDTMTAHLAGAMAKPVWIALPAIADWRWMLNTPLTPWYPTAQLFRQSASGNWVQPLTEMQDKLQARKVSND